MDQTGLLKMIVLLILTCVLNSSALDCFIDTTNRKCTFGSKTPYRFIANLNNSRLNYEGCRERKIWMMIRHGTRNPLEKNVRLLMDNIFDLRDRILESHKNGDLKMDGDSVRAFYNWDTQLSVDSEAKLAPEGEDEMVEIASRMQDRFPTLLPAKYNQSLYDFNFTPTQRTQQSAKYFMYGLFSEHEPEIQNLKEDKTFILRFYKFCQRWKMGIRKNVSTQKEKHEFRNGQVVKTMLQSISNKLGFEVNIEQAELMRMMCVFETALNKSINSPWCDVFSFDQLKILEYVEDLRYYWNDGYAHDLTYKQACPALVDMFKFFESPSDRLATLYFSHSGTILKLLGILNIAKEEHHLTHDTFLLHRDNRKWRTSLIDTFASNIAFVLYDCERDGPAILTMHQERAVYLPGCPKNRPCPLDLMKELYVDNEDECRFDEMCSWYNKTEL